jgi:hypothetical protein
VSVRLCVYGVCVCVCPSVFVCLCALSVCVPCGCVSGPAYSAMCANTLPLTGLHCVRVHLLLCGLPDPPSQPTNEPTPRATRPPNHNHQASHVPPATNQPTIHLPSIVQHTLTLPLPQVRKDGGHSGHARRELPAHVQARLDEMWKTVVAPMWSGEAAPGAVTTETTGGLKDYAALRRVVEAESRRRRSLER